MSWDNYQIGEISSQIEGQNRSCNYMVVPEMGGSERLKSFLCYTVIRKESSCFKSSVESEVDW